MAPRSDEQTTEEGVKVDENFFKKILRGIKRQFEPSAGGPVVGLVDQDLHLPMGEENRKVPAEIHETSDNMEATTSAKRRKLPMLESNSAIAKVATNSTVSQVRFPRNQDELNKLLADVAQRGYAIGFQRGYAIGFQKAKADRRKMEKLEGMDEKLTESRNLEYISAMEKLSSMKLLSIEEFLPPFAQLATLGPIDPESTLGVGINFPVCGMVYATCSLIDELQSNRGPSRRTLSAPHQSKSAWAICATACQIKIVRGEKDLDDGNIQIVCKCIKDYYAGSLRTPRFYGLGPPGISWPQDQGPVVQNPDNDDSDELEPTSAEEPEGNSDRVGGQGHDQEEEEDDVVDDDDEGYEENEDNEEEEEEEEEGEEEDDDPRLFGLWNERVIEDIIKSQTGALVVDFNQILRDLYPGARLVSTSSQGIANGHGYGFLNQLDPAQTDSNVAFQYVVKGTLKTIYLLCEEYNHIKMGLGKKILEEYKGYHDCDIEELNQELHKFCREHNLPMPNAHKKTLFLTSHQAIVQACLHHCRNFVISDGTVYMILHLSKNQMIEQEWPLEKKYFSVTKKLSPTKFKHATMNTLENSPAVRVDKVSIVTNEERSIVGAGTMVVFNELFRYFPMIRDALEIYSSKGLDEARKYAQEHPLRPNKQYFHELDDFWERFRRITRRRLATFAEETTKNGVTISTQLFQLESVLQDRSGKDPFRNKGRPSIFKVKWNGKLYILKVYPYDFAGVERYTNEWYAHEVATKNNLTILASMVLNGRLNQHQRLLNADSAGSTDSGKTLVEEQPELNAPFFTVTEVALGSKVDFSNKCHVKLVRSALKELDEVGIPRPAEKESNFFVTNNQITVIGFGEYLADKDSDSHW